jgi:hypothetical protein
VDVLAILICCCTIGGYKGKNINIPLPENIFFADNAGCQKPEGGDDHIQLKTKGEVMLSRKIKNFKTWRYMKF